MVKAVLTSLLAAGMFNRQDSEVKSDEKPEGLLTCGAFVQHANVAILSGESLGEKDEWVSYGPKADVTRLEKHRPTRKDWIEWLNSKGLSNSSTPKPQETLEPEPKERGKCNVQALASGILSPIAIERRGNVKEGHHLLNPRNLSK